MKGEKRRERDDGTERVNEKVKERDKPRKKEKL